MKDLSITLIRLTAILLLSLLLFSCTGGDEITKESEARNEAKQEQKESPYKKITAYSLTANEKHHTFTDADDYKSGMAEYISKYKSEELLCFIVKVDFSPDYDTKKLNVIEYIDKQNNDESCITYNIAPEKFDPELLVKLCEDEDMISIGVWANVNLIKFPT